MQNVGGLDRVLRIVLGLILLTVALLPPFAGFSVVVGLGAWKWAVAAVGAVMLLTGVLRVCPAYLPFGVNTCRKP